MSAPGAQDLPRAAARGGRRERRGQDAVAHVSALGVYARHDRQARGAEHQGRYCFFDCPLQSPCPSSSSDRRLLTATGRPLAVGGRTRYRRLDQGEAAAPRAARAPRSFAAFHCGYASAPGVRAEAARGRTGAHGAAAGVVCPGFAWHVHVLPHPRPRAGNSGAVAAAVCFEAACAERDLLGMLCTH